MNTKIYVIQHIPDHSMPLSFLEDATILRWWIKNNDNHPATLTTDTETIQLKQEDNLTIKYISFYNLPEDVQGYLRLYNYDIVQLRLALGRTDWLNFLALHFKENCISY